VKRDQTGERDVTAGEGRKIGRPKMTIFSKRQPSGNGDISAISDEMTHLGASYTPSSSPYHNALRAPSSRRNCRSSTPLFILLRAACTIAYNNLALFNLLRRKTLARTRGKRANMPHRIIAYLPLL